MNWKVRAYHNDTLLEEWVIENRTESEAFGEAEADIKQIANCNDWSLTKQGGPDETINQKAKETSR